MANHRKTALGPDALHALDDLDLPPTVKCEALDGFHYTDIRSGQRVQFGKGAIVDIARADLEHLKSVGVIIEADVAEQQRAAAKQAEEEERQQTQERQQDAAAEGQKVFEVYRAAAQAERERCLHAATLARLVREDQVRRELDARPAPRPQEEQLTAPPPPESPPPSKEVGYDMVARTAAVRVEAQRERPKTWP